MNIVDIRNLSVKDGKVQILESIDLSIKSGNVTVLMGPNGAGKSTLINSILGFRPYQQGTISVNSNNHNSLMASDLNIAFVADQPNLYGHLTGMENLDIAVELLGVSPASIPSALHSVNLEIPKKRKVKNFSMGMKQRLAIAKSLLVNPDLIVLDEPTNGLDPLSVIDVRNIIRNLADNGVAVLICTHAINDIEPACDDYVLLNHGKVVNRGTLHRSKTDSKLEMAIHNGGSTTVLDIQLDNRNDLTRLSHALSDAEKLSINSNPGRTLEQAFQKTKIAPDV